MSKKKAKGEEKTLVEKILDKNKIAYEPVSFSTHQDGDVMQIDEQELSVAEHEVYKTLVLTGNKTGPVVGIVPLDTHIDYKKLSHVSGNKKVGMVPLKDLVKTSGYEHGANNPVGIHERHNYPIFFGNEAKEAGTIIISAGKIGRSVKINAEALAKFVGAQFADITSQEEG
ncbi:aminoacyl-tRNA deacylase [Lacticaseibacillus pabuli]|uniref:Cys-tRNA(Pro)/Cys-tRNA(Cys) deacylase n=1 Tax=Lacticaseibacillus pabuli TaxID=3025672 RepID=A0ABY7WVF0_9LACO|nr:aminoacyl-tRNA deacylase [Lacticaseibacillus sp. KACC 23028]WDF83764.1 aminoacyl-tRNA deacylase [Lacticaseibacillus sp. KACC 23028]